MTKLGRLTDVIAEEYRDADGYWIYLKPGWRNGQDPVGRLHQIHEDTKREARSWLRNVLPCDCADCLYEIARRAKATTNV